MYISLTSGRPDPSSFNTPIQIAKLHLSLQVHWIPIKLDRHRLRDLQRQRSSGLRKMKTQNTKLFATRGESGMKKE
jgi:hypothetical protein